MLPLYDDESIPSFPRHKHDHLKRAAFQGFLAHKDMVALALYILNNAESLELMTVQTNYKYSNIIADKFLRREDPRNVLKIL
uniref:At1g61320/AtMIF1 LRR domain-containing protein n=1 Tax=Arundo donax TaxID=35708 RepID=A0A0A9CQW4_ARUDO